MSRWRYNRRPIEQVRRLLELRRAVDAGRVTREQALEEVTVGHLSEAAVVLRHPDLVGRVLAEEIALSRAVWMARARPVAGVAPAHGCNAGVVP